MNDDLPCFTSMFNEFRWDNLPVYHSVFPDVRLCESWGLRRCEHHNRIMQQISLHSWWLSHSPGLLGQVIRAVLAVVHWPDYCARPAAQLAVPLCPCPILVFGYWNNCPWLRCDSVTLWRCETMTAVVLSRTKFFCSNWAYADESMNGMRCRTD